MSSAPTPPREREELSAGEELARAVDDAMKLAFSHEVYTESCNPHVVAYVAHELWVAGYRKGGGEPTEAMVADFQRYADHVEGCSIYHTPESDNAALCDCGFVEAWYRVFPGSRPTAQEILAAQRWIQSRAALRAQEESNAD